MSGIEVALIAAAVATAGAQVAQGIQQERFARESARGQESAAAIEAERIRTAGARHRAAQFVGFARGGVAPLGTPLDVFRETAAVTEHDALTAMAEGQARADSIRFQGEQARIAGFVQGGSTLIQSGFAIHGMPKQAPQAPATTGQLMGFDPNAAPVFNPRRGPFSIGGSGRHRF